MLRCEGPKTYPANVRRNPPHAQVIVLIGLDTNARPSGIVQPTLEVGSDWLVATDHQLAGCGRLLRGLQSFLDYVAVWAGEELLATVRHAEVGHPASVLQRIDRAVAAAASLYSWSGHEVDILPSTTTQGKALYDRFRRRDIEANTVSVRLIEDLVNEGFEVALEDAPRPTDVNRPQLSDLHLLVDVRSPDRKAPRRLIDREEERFGVFALSNLPFHAFTATARTRSRMSAM